MNVTMLPFGNARIKGDTVTCQHGEEECQANSWEQCVIDSHPDFSDYWPFYLCLEQKLGGGPFGPDERLSKATAQCALSTGMNHAKLEACVTDPTKSFALQKEFAAKTPNHPAVPYVLINGKVSPSSGSDLLKEVCKAYTGMPPAGCTKLLETAPCSNDW